MSSLPASHQFPVFEAGTVVVTFEPDGARVLEVVPAPGWTETVRHPKGWFKRRRPATFLNVTLSQDTGPWRREGLFELVREDEGGEWVMTVTDRAYLRPLGTIACGGGSVDVSWDGGELKLHEVQPAEGWEVSQVDGPNDHDTMNWDLIVEFTLGRETWGVIVDATVGEMPAGQAGLDVEHISRLAP